MGAAVYVAHSRLAVVACPAAGTHAPEGKMSLVEKLSQYQRTSISGHLNALYPVILLAIQLSDHIFWTLIYMFFCLPDSDWAVTNLTALA